MRVGEERSWELEGEFEKLGGCVVGFVMGSRVFLFWGRGLGYNVCRGAGGFILFGGGC